MATVLCLVTGYMVIDALSFPFRVQLGPLTFSGITFVFAVVVLVNEVRKFRASRRRPVRPRPEGKPAGGGDAAADPSRDEDDNDRLTRAELVAFGWLAAVVAAFFLLGFLVGMPLFMLALMRVYGRESWGLAIAVAAGVMLVVYVLFVELLGVPVYPGVLPRYLGLGG